MTLDLDVAFYDETDGDHFEDIMVYSNNDLDDMMSLDS